MVHPSKRDPCFGGGGGGGGGGDGGGGGGAGGGCSWRIFCR